MSFASYCKDEASMIDGMSSCCKMASLEAMLRLNSEIIRHNGSFMINFTNSNTHVVKYFMNLVKDLYNCDMSLISKESTRLLKKKSYVVSIINHCDSIINELNLFSSSSINHNDYETRDCCIKGYLRGAFLARGSVNDPQKSEYHLEIASRNEQEAIYIQRLMNHFDLNAKLSKRRNDIIIYIKEISSIADFLRIIGISQMVFKLEEIQIQREFKNNLNRKVNSEIANEIKTLDAAKAQLLNIQYLEYNYPLEKLDPKILLIMKVRKDHPDSSFKELLEVLNNDYGEKITKSGLNHRFIKIKELVEETKKTKND